MLSVFDQGPHRPCPAAFNLAAYVMQAGQTVPDKTALAVVHPTGSETWSYARLRRAVMGTAAGLRATSALPGDKVLLRLGNTVDFPVAYLGAIWAGLVPVPTSAQLTEAEVARMIALLAPAMILHDTAVACPQTNVPRVTSEQMHLWRDGPGRPPDLGPPERLAYIVFTSGTSGQQRAVGHAHRAIWARQMMLQHWYDLRPKDRMMHAGAFNWTYTLGTGLLDPWTKGATALILAQGVTPAALPTLMAAHNATIFAAAPGVYRQILKSNIPRLPQLRHGLSAGEKLPLGVQQAWHDATGTQVYEAYGLSECSTFISASPARPAPSGTLGRPQPGRRVAILGDDGPVPLGTPGHIAVARDDPGLMLGYIGAPEATHAKFQGDWFVTGDQGLMAADGAITYLGRGDDMMNAGGFRVSPLEVEAALQGFDGLHDVGVTDVEVRLEVWVIAAFYVADHDLEDQALAAHAAQALARYKQPRLFQRVASLPRNANGKLMRGALRQRVVKES